MKAESCYIGQIVRVKDEFEGVVTEINEYGAIVRCKGEPFGHDCSFALMEPVIVSVINNQKREFKPFDRVLVRKQDDEGQYWQPHIYSFFHPAFKEHVMIDGMMYAECLHYEGNEYLAGTIGKPLISHKESDYDTN